MDQQTSASGRSNFAFCFSGADDRWSGDPGNPFSGIWLFWGWWYENEYIYLEGLTDLNRLRFIWVTGAFTDSDEDGDEDDIKIPGWMIPDIKAMIIKNELAFILNMPSDDDNNSTLTSVKPEGPQQDEK